MLSTTQESETLRESNAARGLNFAEAGDAIFAHAGHDHGETGFAEFAGHRVEEHRRTGDGR